MKGDFEMNLKRILAGVLTGAMVISGIPAMNLDSVAAWAATTEADGEDGTNPDDVSNKGTGLYRYKTLLDDVEVSSDGSYRALMGVDRLVEPGQSFAYSRFNTGGMPVSRELTENNNIYVALNSASNLSKMTWWTNNVAKAKNEDGTGAYDYGRMVQEGTLLRCRVSVTKDAVTEDTKDTVNWTEANDVWELDTNQNDHEGHDSKRMGHDVDLTKLFEETALTGVRAVKLEVLNTAANYTRDGENAPIIAGNEVQMFNGEQEVVLNGAASVYTDFSFMNPSQTGGDKLIDGEIANKTGDDWETDSSEDNMMKSGGREGDTNAKLPAVGTEGEFDKFTDNNNIYFKVPEDREGENSSRLIGRLTYMAGSVYGSIDQCKIYTVNKYIGENDDPADIPDEEWEEVFSNVLGELVGQTEKLGSDGKSVRVEPEVWGAYTENPVGWENAHATVFSEPKNDTYVRMEVIQTKNNGASLTNVQNKWISGKRVYLFEAEEIMSANEVSLIRVEQKAPVYKSTLGKPAVVDKGEAGSGAAFLMDGVSWKVRNAGENKNQNTSLPNTEGDYTVKANKIYTLEAIAYVKEPATVVEDYLQVYFNGVEMKKLGASAGGNAGSTESTEEDDNRGTVEVLSDKHVIESGDEAGTYTGVKLTYEFEAVKDPNESYLALKKYLKETAQPKYMETGGKNENGSGDPVYTDRGWNAFVTNYETAVKWTTELPDGEDQDGNETGGVTGPSGHTDAEYAKLLEDLRKALVGLEKAKLDGRTEVVPLGEDVKVEINQPKDNELPEEAKIPIGKISNEDVTIVREPGFAVDADHWITGKATAPRDGAGNDKFEIRSESFMVSFQIKVAGKIDDKQSILGMMNDGYGVQIVSTQNSSNPYSGNNNMALIAYGYTGSWIQAQYEIPENDTEAQKGQWFGTKENPKTHDIVVIYNGSKFIMYVDGVKAGDNGKAGALQPDPTAKFSIGYNPNTRGDAGANNYRPDDDEVFKGAFKDFVMYIDEDCPGQEALDALDNASKKSADQDGWSKDTFDAKLEEVKALKTPTFNLEVEAEPYQVDSTKWEEMRNPEKDDIKVLKETDKFNGYAPYRATITLGVDHPFKFESDASVKLLLKKPDGTEETVEIDPKDITVADHDTALIITKNFESELPHPHALLEEYMESLPSRMPKIPADVLNSPYIESTDNKDAAGNRVYTVASWEIFKNAYNTAKTRVGGSRQYDMPTILKYQEAYDALRKCFSTDAADKDNALHEAADTCECEVGDIPESFGGVELHMENDGLAEGLDLMTRHQNLQIPVSGDCIMHKDVADKSSLFSYSFERTGGTAVAEINEVDGKNMLTAKKTGTVEVTFTADYNEGTVVKTANITYSIIGKKAETSAVDSLKDLISEMNEKYTAEEFGDMAGWSDLQDALTEAGNLTAAGADPYEADINYIKEKIEEAASKLDKANENAPLVNSLKEAIAGADAIYEAGNADGKYTAESWEAFKAAYEAVKDLTDAELLGKSKEELQNWTETLKNGLVLANGQGNENAALINSLKAAMTAKKAIYDAGNANGKYTAASWAAFKAAYETVSKMTDEQLNAASKAQLDGWLRTLTSGLVLSTTTPPGGTTNKPGPGGSTGTPNNQTGLKANDPISHSSGSYKVKDAAKLTAVLVKAKSSKKVKVPATVKGSDGKNYKVVEVAAKAFSGNVSSIEFGVNVTKISKNAVNCKKLKTVIFKGKKLPSMNKAFKKTAKKVKVKVAKNLRKSSKVKSKTVKALKKAGIKKATVK